MLSTKSLDIMEGGKFVALRIAATCLPSHAKSGHEPGYMPYVASCAAARQAAKTSGHATLYNTLL